jgi:hypothetical protein
LDVFDVRGVLAFSRTKLRGPVFILGCGRSGTTALGRALSNHPEVSYLNEPRELWATCYPETDIWSTKNVSRRGKLVLTAEDVRGEGSKRLQSMYEAQVRRTRRPVLVDKLPINNFRLEFLHVIFPGAQYLNIVRDGREVARSIEKMIENNKWYGAGSYKWELLVDFARRMRGIEDADELCTTNYERGLLEWSLSVGEVDRYFAARSRQQLLEVSYTDLVDDGAKTIERCLEFIGLSMHPAVEEHVATNIFRKSRRYTVDSFTEKELMIAGELLEKYRDC